VTTGVVQGSPLSSTLFNCYIDEALRLPLHSVPMAFADDLNGVSDDDNITTLKMNINCDLKKIADWFFTNRLKLNSLKSRILVFGPENIRLELLFSFQIDNCPVDVVRSMKLLGVIIDDKLTFDPHIDLMSSKISAANAMILKLRLSGFNRRILLLTLKTLLYTHLYYCTTVWQAAARSKLKSLQVLLNKGIRIVFGLLPRDSTAFYLSHFQLKSVREVINNSVARFIFTNINEKTMNPLIHEQLNHSFISARSTRSSTNGLLFVPAFHTELRRRTIFVSGIRAYNELPVRIRGANSIGIFKRRVADASLPSNAIPTIT
jgi:hypothetical protein